jgi:anaerobic ribonucleoside-triphosphate reductase activating protein
MYYHKIEKTSVSNGTGIRVVLWISGCSLRCKGCQNPGTWDKNSGKLFDDEAKKELFEALDKSYIQGITFSGGHPLEEYNLSDVYILIKEIKSNFPDKDIWLYTGLTFDNILGLIVNNLEIIDDSLPELLEIIKLCDVVVDGMYVESLRDIRLKWCGSSNQRVIDVQKSINEDKIILYE